jgi:hypothetical protein
MGPRGLPGKSVNVTTIKKMISQYARDHQSQTAAAKRAVSKAIKHFENKTSKKNKSDFLGLAGGFGLFGMLIKKING